MSHYPKDVPFEVPEGWVWTTIGDILINRDGERIPVSSAIRKKQNAKLYDYYGAAGVIDKVDDYLFNERLLLVGEDGANLLSRSKDNAFFAEGKYWVNNHAHIIDASDKRLLDYIALYINAIPLDMYVTGSAQPKLNQDNLNRISVPLPPLAEQFRIVQAVEECKRIVNGIENNQIELQEAIDHTKQKILSLAIAGKLVSQDPSDEPAIVLMKRINTAFQASDNLHYEACPKGWVMARLDDIIEIVSGTSFQKADITTPGTGLRILRGGNIQKGDIVLCDDDVYISDQLINERANVKKGDIVIVASTGSSELIGKAALSLQDYPRTQIGAFLRIIRPRSMELSDYLGIIFQSELYKNHIREVAKGTNINNIKASYITEFIIPIPPLEEQQRIIQKVSKLSAILSFLIPE